MRSTKGIMLFIYVALAINVSVSTLFAIGTDDENRLLNIEDAAGMFNERGYSKANSFSLSGNEVINDFNGNLMYTQRLMYLPISENGLHCDLKLTYNGNVSHTAFGARSGSNGIFQTPINLPEWIISINGIAVQTFNFENELISWRSETQGDTISYDQDVAAHIEGYHKCYRETSDKHHGIISILMEDGSVRELYSTSTGVVGPAFMIGGEYNSCSKEDTDRGYLWPISSPQYGEFTLFRSDGTKVDFKVYQPIYRSNVNCGTSFPASRDDYPRILLPIRFRDNMNHAVSLNYSYSDSEAADTIWGRPILSSAGVIEFRWSDWDPGITYPSNLLEIEFHGGVMHMIGFAGTPPEDGVTVGRAVSWRYNANRGLVYSIDNHEQEPTVFTYRTYARTFMNLRMGSQLDYDICDASTEKFASKAYQLTPWRIWKIQYPEGGQEFLQYYIDPATRWGQVSNLGARDTLSVSYDHSEDCTSNQLPRFPCKKSEAFDFIGRDPFFLNMVVGARRTLNGVEVINTDSLEFGWMDNAENEVIDSEDLFNTNRWFGKESIEESTTNDQVKERKLVYRYFPEKGTFSHRSRDRGWVMKMMSSTEKDSRTTSNQTKKNYYWDTDCNGLICLGTLLLDSLKTTRNSESYWERYAYYWLGDPSLDTVNILTSKETIDAWGVKTEITYDTRFVSLANPATAYFNSELVSQERTLRQSDGALLRKRDIFHYSTPFEGGFPGQLRSVTDYLFDENENNILTTINHYEYNTASGLGIHCGSTRFHVDPRGDTTYYYYASGSESITFREQAYDGSVETKTTDIDYSNSGPTWFKMMNRCNGQTIVWYQKMDERGRILWVVEPNSYRSELTYDDLNRVHKIILPGGYKPATKDPQLPPGPQDTAWSIWNFYDDEYNEYVPDPISVKQLVRLDRDLPSKTSRVWIDGLSRAYRHDVLNNSGDYDSVLTGFDYAGRAILQTDQLGLVTETEYDHLDRPVKTTYPDPAHSFSSTTYTIATAADVGLDTLFDFPETIIFKNEFLDENGHAVIECYDVREKLRLKQTFDGQTALSTYFDYDDLGNLILTIKPKGDSVKYAYNSLGQLVEESSADYGHVSGTGNYGKIEYFYDKSGNLDSMKDANCAYQTPPRHLYYKYDKMDRLIHTGIDMLFLGNHLYFALQRNFYDQSNSELSIGRLSLVFNFDSFAECNYAERYDYDPRGRVTKQVNYFNAVLDSALVGGSRREYHSHGDSVVIQYTYDWADQLKSITYPDGSVVNYDYDVQGRLVSVGGAQPSEFDRYARLGYTKRNQLETMLLGGGLQQLDYAYNERGWLQSINDGVSSGVAPNDMFGQSLYYYSHPVGYAGWSPQYNGNLLGQKTSTQGQEFTFAYRYDESDRLKDVYLSSAPLEDFSYDTNGNITQRHYWTSSKSEITKDYRYIDGTNKLTIADRAHSFLDDSLFYDANGNVTRSSSRKASMTYDQFSRLTMVVVKTNLGADTILYTYNADGDRIRKEYRYQYRTWCDQQTKGTLGGEKGGDTLSLWCTLSAVKNTYYVLGRGQVLAEQSSPSPSSANAKFIYAGSNRIGMRDESNRLYYYLNDHLGSTRIVIDSTGVPSDLHHYYAFGSTLFEQTNTNQAYRYTGKPLDKEAGLNLYYYGARYYDPELGRFLALDPAAGSYPSLSPYAYCANNPLRLVDPSGESAVDVVMGGLGASVDNVFLGLTLLRSSYEPSDAGDYNLGQDLGDILSIAGGVQEAISGAGTAGLGAVVTAGTGGPGVAVGGPAFAAGVAMVLQGVQIAVTGAINLAMQKGRMSGGNYSNLPEPSNVGPGKDFSPGQKQRILDENARRNGGTVRSDQSGRRLDPASKAQKGVKANMNQAEVDHVRAKSKGGSNSNSNAQVLSKKENLEKGVN